jgi:hypothetical protein
MDKPKHGGQRAGAGRPATLEKPQRITVSLDKATIEALQAIDSNLSKAIRTLARQSNQD